MLYVSRKDLLSDLVVFFGSLAAVGLITFLHAYNSRYSIGRIFLLYCIAGAVWIGIYVAVFSISLDDTRAGGAFVLMMVAYLGSGVAMPFGLAIALAALGRFLRSRKPM
jgi:hypothetical protein